MAYLRAYQAGAMGDPFLGSAFKSIGRGIKRLKPGRLLGGLAGRFAGFIPGGSIARGIVGRATRTRGCGPAMGDPFLGSMLRSAGPAIARAATSFFPGTGAMGSKLGAALGSPMGRAVAGGAAAGLATGLVPRLFGGGGGERRSYRRMNVANVRALRRSIRRVEGFRKLALSTVRLAHEVRPRKRSKRR